LHANAVGTSASQTLRRNSRPADLAQHVFRASVAPMPCRRSFAEGAPAPAAPISGFTLYSEGGALDPRVLSISLPDRARRLAPRVVYGSVQGPALTRMPGNAEEGGMRTLAGALRH